MSSKGRMAGVMLAALVAASGSGPALAAPRPTSPAITKISWHRCADDRTAQCGTVGVPIDRARPERGRVKIAVARAKATAPRKRLGVLLVNPGGPGGSGVDFALDRAGLSKQIRERYDIVGFDPRGVGASHPVKCGKVGKVPRAYPRHQADFAKLKAYHGRLYRACRKKTGLLYDFMGAGSVARDMDAIRAALGEKKISYYGVSYGTWIGQRYAELFPHRIRAMAFDGTMDHSLPGARRFMVDEARGLETSYARFAKWCPTSKYCALRGKNPVKVLDALMKRSERGTLHEIGSPRKRLDPPDLAQMIRVTMYDPLSWPQTSEELRELGRQKVRKIGGPGTRAHTDPTFSGIVCADWAFPVRNHKQLAAVRAATRRAAPHVRLNPLGWEAITSCLGRPRPVRDAQRPYRIKGTPPLLVVGGRADPATVYPWAVGVDQKVPGTSLLTYDGAGHGSYGLSGCTRKTVDAYLLGGRTPAPGARCPAVPPDFSDARTRVTPDTPPRF